MYYRHNLDYTYPERSDAHMLIVKHLRDTNFDENYPYMEKGWWFNVKRAVLWVFLNLVVFPVCTIRYGLKIYGRENLKKHKAVFKDGAISVSNHVLIWDNLCVLKALRPRLYYCPVWATNFEGPNGPVIRWSGGIPVPTHSMRAMASFQRAIEQVLEEKNWLHFFPEGSMWYYYPDVRPIKKAAFKFAVRYNTPVLPITFSFRPRTGIYKLFGKAPLVDLHVGEPLFPDKSLPVLEAMDKLQAETYHVMQVMCGINPGDPTYNTDLNIDNYKKTM